MTISTEELFKFHQEEWHEINKRLTRLRTEVRRERNLSLVEHCFREFRDVSRKYTVYALVLGVDDFGEPVGQSFKIFSDGAFEINPSSSFNDFSFETADEIDPKQYFISFSTIFARIAEMVKT